jgi:transcriptional regulator with XRE-family HTH domain
MQYTLDIYTKDIQSLLDRLAANCKARRLDKGFSRKKLAELTGVPAPTIERFEVSGKISLESFCRIAREFDFYDELSSIMSRTKYSTSAELETINRNRGRRNGR